MNNAKADYNFKVLEVGESGVGKSNLMLRYTEGKFEDNFNSTMASDYKLRVLTLPSGKTVRFQIWDTAGTEKFRTITSSYYRGSNAVFIVYDITNRESFDVVSTWKQEVTKYCSADVAIVLVGNKSDLDGERDVTTAEGQQLAQSMKVPFIETSAKTGSNVEEMFQQLVDILVPKTSAPANFGSSPATVKLEASPVKEEKKKKCTI